MVVVVVVMVVVSVAKGQIPRQAIYNFLLSLYSQLVYSPKKQE
jgi:hypothetical protein